VVTKPELDKVLIEINNILEGIDNRITNLEKVSKPKPVARKATTKK